MALSLRTAPVRIGSICDSFDLSLHCFPRVMMNLRAEPDKRVLSPFLASIHSKSLFSGPLLPDSHGGLLQGSHSGLLQGSHGGLIQCSHSGLLQGSHSGFLQGSHDGSSRVAKAVSPRVDMMILFMFLCLKLLGKWEHHSTTKTLLARRGIHALLIENLHQEDLFSMHLA